ncbi:hypothetical protein V4F39_20300 [Aquincola sp. MAHUQ-54]|uniref:Uncharacterized protein n=1 Tax=Aquincola agrisoli TaxID=3119538 RepID=A0AAW9QHE8_9BURK
MHEVLVRREKREVVPNGELRKQSINGAHLNACSTTCIPQVGCANVIVSIWLEQWQGGESFDDLGLGFCARETLQELLQNQARRDDDIGPEQGIFEFLDLGFGSFYVAAKGQGPDARIHEQCHLPRDRSAL